MFTVSPILNKKVGKFKGSCNKLSTFTYNKNEIILEYSK